MRLLCLGDNNVDIYREQGRIFPGGNCINVAVYAARNGAQAAYLGNLGRDYPGQVQKTALEENRVDTTRIRLWEEPTSAADVQLVDGDRTFSNYTNEIHTAHPIGLTEEELADCTAFDWIHSSCYSILAPDTLPRLKQAGVPLSYDFSLEFTEEDIRMQCPHLEAAFFSCGHMGNSELRRTLSLACQCGCTLAVATRGAEGSVLYDGKQWMEQPAYRINPVDTMGAGDSFIARFIQCYADGMLRKKGLLAELKLLGKPVPELPEYETILLRYCLSQAALFSANNCLYSGAFGHSQPLEET